MPTNIELIKSEIERLSLTNHDIGKFGDGYEKAIFQLQSFIDKLPTENTDTTTCVSCNTDKAEVCGSCVSGIASSIGDSMH